MAKKLIILAIIAAVIITVYVLFGDQIFSQVDDPPACDSYDENGHCIIGGADVTQPKIDKMNTTTHDENGHTIIAGVDVTQPKIDKMNTSTQGKIDKLNTTVIGA